MDFGQLFVNGAVIQKVIGSVLWLAFVAIGRFVGLRAVRDKEWPSDAVRLKLRLRVNQAALFATILGLFVIWAPQIRTLAISAVAIAAAIVIATKELILCLSGSIVRTSSEAYEVGDRIEIGNVRGDVIDYGLLTTTILEIGPAHQRTGRSVVVPNSMLLTSPVVNDTFSDEFVLYTFPVHLGEKEDWRHAESTLLAAAREVTAPYIDDARRHMETMARDHGLTASSSEPRVTVRVGEGGKLTLLVRVPTPTREKGRVEHTIVRNYLEARLPDQGGDKEGGAS